MCAGTDKQGMRRQEMLPHPAFSMKPVISHVLVTAGSMLVSSESAPFAFKLIQLPFVVRREFPWPSLKSASGKSSAKTYPRWCAFAYIFEDEYQEASPPTVPCKCAAGKSHMCKK